MNRIISCLALLAALLAPVSVTLTFAQPAFADYQRTDIQQTDATPTPTPNTNSPSAATGKPSASDQRATPAAATLDVTATVTTSSPSAGSAVTATTSTAVVSDTAPAQSVPVTVTALLTSTAATPVAQTPLTSTAPALSASPADTTATDAQYAGALQGTIIANRTEADVRYFVEGQTYDLALLRSVGLQLPRPTAVLNLFNCDSSKSEADPGCFWDPYLLKQDGFYEVVTGAAAGAAANLILREAGAPPANQIWVQNRTGLRESIIFNNQVVDIAPASVQEFAMVTEGPVIVHLRNCITQGGQTACEWAPKGVEPGYYYGLVKSETTGANNMVLTTVGLEGIVASSGEIVAQPPQGNCVLRVPTLNVRGGPGLEFPIVTKIRGTEEQPASVIVVGFDASKQWLQVSERVAPNGWITANPDFIICTGDLAALPVTTDVLAALPTPTPVPEVVVAEPAPELPTTEPEPITAPAEVAVEPPAVEAAPVESAPVDPAPAESAPADVPADATATESPDAAPQPSGIPTGLARIVVNNGFDQVMRFTLDQQYRVETNNLSGEWDLQPGQSVAVLVYPGMIPFSASTPWQGLAGNANIQVEGDQERALWLYFVPDPDGSGNWNLQY